MDWPEETANSSASKTAWLIASMLERRTVSRAVAEGILGSGVVSWKLLVTWSMWWASSSLDSGTRQPGMHYGLGTFLGAKALII